MKKLEENAILNTKEEIHISAKLHSHELILPKRRLPFSLDREADIRDISREEHKFSITELQFRQYSHRFAKFLKEDPNNGDNGYMVRSLYFDTLNNYDYHNKIDGVDQRRKMRLRIYRTDNEFARLEMKQKQNLNQRKRSLNVKRKDAELICQGIFTPLLQYNDAFALECYTLLTSRCYVPKAVVQYQRLAFIANGNNTRITFDRQIRATESNFDIFDDQLMLYPVMDDFNVILEVKYDGFLYSYIKDQLRQLDKSSIASSKYCLARAATLS